MKRPLRKMTEFWEEIRKRKVVQVIILYATTAFILLQIINLLIVPLLLPQWVVTFFVILLITLFPVAIIFSWIYNGSSKNSTLTVPVHTDPDNKENQTVHTNKPVHNNSIIVLPFDNLSPDPDQSFFSDGLTEEIITDLSFIHDLLVVSRSSAMTFKGTKNTIKEIVDKAQVRYVLEGSVRKSGNNLRIIAQLIDGINDSHIWAEKYSGTLDDIFDIQEKVARSIADALKLKLSVEEKKKIAERPIPNPLAFEYYLKAKSEQWKFTKEGLDNALLYLQKGLDIMGENVHLLAGMGYVYYQYVNLGIWTDDANVKKIEEFAEKVFALDSDSPYGHLILGLRNIWWKDPKVGVRHLKKTLEYNPNDYDALGWSCAVYANLGKNETAKPLVNRLMEVDPLNDWAIIMQGFIQLWSGSFDKAIAIFIDGGNRFPDNYMFPWLLAISYACNQNFKEASQIFLKLSKGLPGDSLGDLFIKYNAALEGDKSEALKWNTPESEVWAWRDFQASYFVTQLYSVANAQMEAMYWLEHAVDIGMINYPFIKDLDPLLENIRHGERFEKLLARVKFEWENFDA